MADIPSQLRVLLVELKRRRVFRVAGIYLATAYGIVKLAEEVFPQLKFPAWTLTFLVVLALLGFPLAVALAWALDITPEGIRRTDQPAPPADGDAPAGSGGSKPQATLAAEASLDAPTISTSATASIEPAPGAPPGSRGRVRDVSLGVVVGVLVGLPLAFLLVGLLHVIAPRALPLTVGRGLLIAAAVVAAAETAVAGVTVWRRRAAYAGAGARDEAGARMAPARRRGEAGLGFALGLVVALSGAYALAPRQDRPAPPGPSAANVYFWYGSTARHRVAVTRFLNVTGDPALEPLGRMAQDWVTRRLRSIPEAELVASGMASADTGYEPVAELLRRTGADVVVFGSFYRDGSDVLLEARLVSLRAATSVHALDVRPVGPLRVPRDRPVTGLEEVASRIAGGVAGECPPLCVAGQTLPTYEARQLFGAALAALRRGDRKTEGEMLRAAIAADSTYGYPYRLIIEMSPCAVTDSIAKLFEAKRQQFGEYDLLYVRAAHADCHGDTEGAYGYHKQMVALAPRWYDSNVGLAKAASNSGRLGEAERIFKAIGEGDWGFGYYESLLWPLHLQGKYSEEFRTMEAARRRYRDKPTAFRIVIPALAALGRTQELGARIGEGSRKGTGALNIALDYAWAALELEWHGYSPAAREFALRTLAELDRVPQTERTSVQYLYTRAVALMLLGRWEETRRSLNSSRLQDGLLMTLTAIAAARSGDPAGARTVLAAIQRLPDEAFPSVPRRVLCEAGILAALGDSQAALRHLADAQERGSFPPSGPLWAHAEYIEARFLWHNPEFERMVAARD